MASENIQKLKETYEKYKNSGKKLDMSRGKPAAEQLDTVEKLLSAVSKDSDCFAEDGFDCRNYGILGGLPEAKKLFASMLSLSPDEIIVCGNSSLNIMFDTISRNMIKGVSEDAEPWHKCENVAFLCPAPGYDRHFAICEYFGIRMINVKMNADGPDMDFIEEAVRNDDSIKGIWSIPKYSNPTGVTYSDEVVRRFAALKPKAKDFRVFWDNAYCVHDLTDTPDTLLNVLEEAKKYGNEDLFYIFTSTSKISYPGAGIAAVGASKKNIKYILDSMQYQTIGYDKLNQLRHVKMYPSKEAYTAQMKKHMEIIKPKFDAVYEAFEREFKGIDGIKWSKPNGGYFISLDLPKGTAKKVVDKAAEAGLILTGAGATYPYKKDPDDSNIRIAPTFPSLEALNDALVLFCCTVKLVLNECGYER